MVHDGHYIHKTSEDWLIHLGTPGINTHD